MTFWVEGRDGDDGLLALYERHYSARKYRDGRKRALCAGPGYRIVLTTLMYDAGLIWKWFKPMNDQQGVYCSFFRNEGPTKSSVLLREAMDIALKRWPGERLYTYVDARAVTSTNPGYCYKVCGWKECGRTKRSNLIILEYKPVDQVHTTAR